MNSNELHHRLNEMTTWFEYYNSLNPVVFSRIVPHVVYVDSKIFYKIEVPTTGSTNISWNNIEFDFESLCNDANFYNAISTVRKYTFDQTAWLQNTITYYESFKEILATEIDKRK